MRGVGGVGVLEYPYSTLTTLWMYNMPYEVALHSDMEMPSRGSRHSTP